MSDPSETGDPEGSRPLTVLNLAPAPARADIGPILEARPDWLVVNESEAAAVLGGPVGGLTEAARAAADLVTGRRPQCGGHGRPGRRGLSVRRPGH